MEITDARGRRHPLGRPARRVVSLVPSTTQSLIDLGRADVLVGVTRYCPQPAGRQVPVVGGTKAADVAHIASLTPDLVLTNCEEATRALLAQLDAVAPTWAAFPKDLDGALDDLRDTATLIGADATAWIDAIRAARSTPPARRLRVAWMIWRSPWMAVGGDTFVSAMLDAVGCDNALAGMPDRYPTLDLDALAAAAPDVVALSSEPFAFDEAHADEIVAHTGLRRDQIRFADGRLSWHGTHMLAALRALLPDPLRAWPTTPPAP